MYFCKYRFYCEVILYKIFNKLIELLIFNEMNKFRVSKIYIIFSFENYGLVKFEKFKIINCNFLLEYMVLGILFFINLNVI